MSDLLWAQWAHLLDLLDQIENEHRPWADFPPQLRAMQREARRLPGKVADALLTELFKAEGCAKERDLGCVRRWLQRAAEHLP